MKFTHSFAIGSDPEHSMGYDNEAVCDLVDEAIAYGVRVNGGRKETMSIVFATMWADGWCEAAGLDEKESKFLHDAVSHYFFI